ncbi:MAG: hypothetical protein QHC79_09510 [Pseudosphingobacterium sp.]|nr:hypothetical protein [Pseudosphingobacterium sp.]
MAVTINNIPKLSFSQNEVKVVITSDDYLDTEGAIGVYKLDYDLEHSPNIGQGYVNFVLQNKSILYGYGGPTPGPLPIKGYDLPLAVFGETRETYAPKLRNAIDAGYRINSDFIVTVDPSDNTILITARDVGSYYSLAGTTGAGFTLTQLVEPTDRKVKPRFQHHFQIWNRDLNRKIYETNVPLDYPENGATTMDISTILHALVSLDIPNLSDTFQRCPNSMFPFIIKYANRFGTTQTIKELYRTGVLFAVYGGYSMMALANIDSPTHLQDYLMKSPTLYEIQNWFESYPIDDIEVKTNQPQFLYFINSRDVSEVVRIRVVATLTDGTTQMVIREAGEVASFEKVCFNVGYEGLGLTTLTTDIRQVTAYEVYLIGADDQPRTVSKKFKINRDYEANTRYFLYAGSDGNFKTLRTFGVAEGTTEYEPITGFNIGLQQDRLKKGDVLCYEVESSDNEEVHSGYIVGSQKQNNLKELLLSTATFRVFGKQLVPIVFTTTSMSAPREKTGAHTVKIGYRIAWNERLYTGDTWALSVPQINQSQEALNDI